MTATAPATRPEHSPLGASGMQRWHRHACPGSNNLAANLPDHSSPYAREGSAAHEAAEETIAQAVAGGFSIVSLDDIPVPADFTEVEAIEMRSAVKTYVNSCLDLIAEAVYHAVEQAIEIEPPASYPQLNGLLYGTSDFFAVVGDTLVIADFKYGKGVAVYAAGNMQMLYYAYGVWQWLETHRPDLVRRVTHIEVQVHQPRVSVTPSTWRIPVIDLLIWVDQELYPSAALALEPDAPLNPGLKQCQFCRARGSCKALHRTAVAAAMVEFDDNGAPDRDVTALTDAEIGEIMHNVELVRLWLNAVQAEASVRISSGHDVPGWKLVRKRANRQWSAALDVDAMMSDSGLDPYQERKLKSPAQIEKLGIAIPPEYIETPEGGTTLVPADDKRPAVDYKNTNPGADFT